MIEDEDVIDGEEAAPAGSPRSSARVLSAVKKAERAFNNWQGICDTIDDIYAREDGLGGNAGYVGSDTWTDPEYDLFWASTEVLKPAVYAKPPVPVVSPQFKDKRRLQSTTAELLERSVTSAFDRTSIDEGMLCARDDLIFYNRGQLWVTYETDEKGGGQRVCVEHLDRKDFVHVMARKWSDVPMVARRAWMWPKEARKRFKPHSGDAYKDAKRSTGEGEDKENKGKIGVWEVWDRENDRVSWVSEGVSVMLDEGKPHLKLRGFFPCPRPAYGTLKPRTLEPRPDYIRYAAHFAKINSLTRRIYDLLDMVRMKGLIPAGGDIGDAVEQALKDDTNAALLIPVPAAALISGSAGGFVQWLPLEQIAAAITGLIEARRELFADYDRLSGISDIMRGETDANETLGAQQLKSQYGSVRVREKIDELQRLARDVTQIAAEIMAEHFSKDTLLEMSQMEIPTKAEIERRIKAIETAAKEELSNLTKRAEQMIAQAKQRGEQVDPQQAQEQFEQAKQQIITKYSARLQQESDQVPIDDVMKLLRDDRARGFAFEIATDSTIMTDELQEKASRNEFLTVFSGATQGLIGLSAMGEPAAKLAGGILKFVLAPYRVGRELDALIDDFIDSAPEMAAAAQGGEGDGAAELAAAQNKLAEAEMVKAQAQSMKVQTDAQGKMQDLQLRMAQAQQKAADDQRKLELEVGKAQEQARAAQAKAADDFATVDAKINLMQAQTAEILNKIGLDVRKQDLEEYRAVEETQARAVDQSLAAEAAARDANMAERGEMRADRQQVVSEEQGVRSDDRADRQQDFAERSSDRQIRLAERQAERERTDA